MKYIFTKWTADNVWMISCFKDDQSNVIVLDSNHHGYPAGAVLNTFKDFISAPSTDAVSFRWKDYIYNSIEKLMSVHWVDVL